MRVRSRGQPAYTAARARSGSGEQRAARRLAPADAEVEAIRGLLAAHPRPADLAERRRRLDALGRQYALPADVRVEPVRANGVAAAWTATPGGR